MSNIFSDKLYEPGVIVDTSSAYRLIASEKDGVFKVDAVEKKNLGVWDRFLISIGWHSSSLTKVADCFQRAIAKHSYDKIVEFATVGKSTAQINNLINNLNKFYGKCKKYNQGIWVFSLRDPVKDKDDHLIARILSVWTGRLEDEKREKARVENEKIEAEKKAAEKLAAEIRLLDEKNRKAMLPPPSPPSLMDRLKGLFSPKAEAPKSKLVRQHKFKVTRPAPPLPAGVQVETRPRRAAPEAAAPLSPISPGFTSAEEIRAIKAPASQAPIAFNNYGNTCYFASLMQFFSALPTLIDVALKSVYNSTKAESVNKGGIRDCIVKVAKELVTQTSKDKSSFQEDQSSYKELMAKVGIGHAMQDAHEFLNSAICRNIDNAEEMTGKQDFLNPRISTKLVQQNTIINYKIVQQYDADSPEFKKLFNVTKREIDLTENELKQGLMIPLAEVNTYSDQYITPLDCVNRENGYISKRYDTFQECFDTFLAPEQAPGIKLFVKPRDSSKWFLLEGNRLNTNRKLAHAPELFMFRYKRDANYEPNFERNSARDFVINRIDHAISTPKRLVIPGKHFSDNISRTYILCAGIQHKESPKHYTALQLRNGTFYKNCDISGVSTLNNDESQSYIDHSDIFGYVEESVFNQIQSA